MDSNASSDQSWLITSCPECSRQIKARKEILLSNLAIECPHCKSSLNLDNGSSNHKKFQYAKGEDLQEKGTEKRRRRRTKKTKLIAWDLEESDSKEEESENEDLSNPEHSGNEQRIRKRRIRKNKQRKAYQTFTGIAVYNIS